jgi:hypothetical protein
MKKILIALVLMIPVLSGCLIIEIPYAVTIVGTPVLATNHQDNSGKSVICDDKTTFLVYSFRFQGTLTSWRSYLEGPTEGISEQSDVTLTFNSTGVSYDSVNNKVDVRYQILPGGAPKLVAFDSIQPNISLDVTDKLVLEIKQAGKEYSADLKIVTNCQAQGID